MNSVINLEDFEYLAKNIPLKNYSGQRILVTGSTGMIGSWITTFFANLQQFGVDTPDSIVALIHSGDISNISTLAKNPKITFSTSRELLSNQKLNFDLIVHAASPASPTKYLSAEAMNEINNDFLKSLLNRCKTNPKLIYLSSGEVYGAGHSGAVSESTPLNIDTDLSRSMYPLAKLATEKTIQKASNGSEIKFNIFRIFHSFGPGLKRDDGRSFADFIWRAAEGQIPELHSSGGHVRSFLYLRDLVTGLLGTPLKNEIYNIGGELPLSVKDFAERVSEVAGLSGKILIRNAHKNDPYSPNQISYPDVQKLLATGWRPSTPLDYGIQSTLNWAREKLANSDK